MAIDRECLGDKIRRTIIDRIVSGTLKPGERLVEMTLAREFQTSQTPVREAIHDLEAMRMVESLPHRGVRVREVSEQEMVEAYAIRGLLEEYAAMAAADRLVGNVASLRSDAAGIQEAAERGDVAGYAELDLAFHRAVMVAAENSTLLRLWDSLAFEFRTPLMMTRYPIPNLAATAAEHLPIAEALDAGAGATAGRLLRQHAESFIPTITQNKRNH